QRAQEETAKVRHGILPQTPRSDFDGWDDSRRFLPRRIAVAMSGADHAPFAGRGITASVSGDRERLTPRSGQGTKAGTPPQLGRQSGKALAVRDGFKDEGCHLAGREKAQGSRRGEHGWNPCGHCRADSRPTRRPVKENQTEYLKSGCCGGG